MSKTDIALAALIVFGMVTIGHLVSSAAIPSPWDSYLVVGIALLVGIWVTNYSQRS